MNDFWEASWAWFAGWTALRRAQRAVGRWSLFSSSLSKAIFCAFGGIWERFWKVLGGQNGSKKRCFGRFFSMLFSNAIFCRFFVFFASPNLDFCAHSQCFVMIFTKSTFWKNCRKIIDLGSILEGQNDEKSRKNRVEQHVFF